MNEKNTKKTRTIIIILGAIVLLFVICSLSIYYLITSNSSRVTLKSIEVSNYNKDTDIIDINVTLNDKLYNKDLYCYLSDDGNSENIDSTKWIKVNKSSCSFSVKFNDYFIFIKDSDGEIINSYNLNDNVNEIVDFSISTDTVYLAENSNKSVFYNIKYIGNHDILWEAENPEIVKFENDIIYGLKKGSTKVIGKLDDSKIEFNVVVTNLITKMPEHFNYKKSYLGCGVYSASDANLMDKILESRVMEAGGYNTRAAVVAAARFLTLEFPYRIDYFFENGRVSVNGANYADGEGRYYHVGLYLNSNKFSTIKYSFAGPVIWGCPLMNYEDFGSKYVSGRPNSNGLDCSGFVSWAIVNGGFDVGDRGAGETSAPGEMTDLGERVTVTKELVDSNTIKAGDLVNWWGHIGIIIGIDDTTIYVAESLDVYNGLVIKEYTKEEMPDYWTFVMKMDSVYEKDGNYEAMWY